MINVVVVCVFGIEIGGLGLTFCKSRKILTWVGTSHDEGLLLCVGTSHDTLVASCSSGDYIPRWYQSLMDRDGDTPGYVTGLPGTAVILVVMFLHILVRMKTSVNEKRVCRLLDSG